MPNGFITMIQGAVVGTGGASLTQTVINRGPSNTSVNLSQLDECIDLVKGSSNRSDLVIVGSFAGLRQLNKVLQANQRFMEYGEIKAGFRVRQYDGIPMVVSTGMPNALNFNTTTGACTGYSGASYSALMVLNTRDCYISELTPITVEPLAKTSSTFDEFEMYADVVPVMENTLSGALLVGLTIA